MKAMILSAVLGTRMRPFTDKKPKALIEIAGRPLLEIVITNLIKSGFDEIIINVHHFADQIIELLNLKNNFNIRIDISDERNELLDTGGGLKKASWFFDDGKPFLVHNVDIITDLNLKEMMKFHNERKALVTLAVRKRETSRYLLLDKSTFELCGWTNVKTGEVKMAISGRETNRYAFSGIHIIDPVFFNLVGEKKKFYIIDEYLKLAKNSKIAGFDHSDSLWLDIGRPESLEEAERMAKV
jgi:NDP-sugar pyrophosphorylase family protein